MKKHKFKSPDHITSLFPQIFKKGIWICKSGYIFKVHPHEFGIEEKVIRITNKLEERQWELYYGTDDFIGSINLNFGTYKVLWALTKRGLTSK